MRTLLKKVLTDSSIYSIEPIMKKAILFLLLPLYTAYLTPSDFGTLEYIATISLFFSIIASGGLETGFFKYGFAEETKIRKIILFNTLLSFLGISVITFISAYFLKDYFFKSKVLSFLFLIYLLGNLIQRLFRYILLVLRYQYKAKLYVIIAVSSFLILIAFNIILITHYKLGFEGIIYANLISSVLSLLFFISILWKELSFSINFTLIKKLYKFSLPLAPANIAALIMTMSDRIFLEKFSSSTELGLYSYGYKFGMLINILIITPFYMGWGPYKWQIYKTNNAKEIYKKIFDYLSNGLLIVVFIFNIIFTFAGSIMTSNPEYIKGLSILPLILSSYYFVGILTFQSLGIFFKNKTYFLTLTIGLSALINLLLNYLLIPQFGMIGASIATLISYCFYFIIFYLINQRYYYIPFDKKNLLLNIVTILLFSGILVFVNLNYNKYYYLINFIITFGIGTLLLIKFKKEIIQIKKRILK